MIVQGQDCGHEVTNTKHLLSGTVPDVFSFLLPRIPSIVIWYLELNSSSESSVDTVNSSVVLRIRRSGSVV